MSNSFMADWVYTDTVKDHFMNPRNIWNKDENWEPDAFGEVGSFIIRNSRFILFCFS